MNHWTSVSEGMPPYDQPVLVHYFDVHLSEHRQGVATLDPSWLEYKPDTDPAKLWVMEFDGSSMHEWDFTVTHWKSLPDPPTGV